MHDNGAGARSMRKKLLSMIAAFCLLVVVLGAQILAQQVSADAETKKRINGNPVDTPARLDLEQMQYYGLDVFETTLPVVYIDTENRRITKENKVWASMQVLEAKPDGTPQSVQEIPDYEAAITINYRGASSYSGFDKKQYRIKFYNKEGSSNAKNVTFLGMGANSEWVLNGPFLDKTLLRNRLAYETARDIFEWAPDNRYVEVFLNGEYQGVYLAIEPVTNGESRLRLSEFGLLSGETSYVVKRDRIETEENPLEVYGKTAGKTNNDLFIDYPSSSDLTETQREWITEDINRFEEVLYGEGFDDPKTGYMQYIDVNNFVDYVIFNEVFMNNDAGNLSTYLYKELTGKLQIAVWDYNNCLDNYQGVKQDFTEFYTVNRTWFSRMLQDREFMAKVVERYRQLRQSVLSTDSVNARIDGYQEELGPAIDRNYAVWGYVFDTNMLVGAGRDITSYEDAITQLKEAYEMRTVYLDEHIEDLYDNCVK